MKSNLLIATAFMALFTNTQPVSATEPAGEQPNAMVGGIIRAMRPCFYAPTEETDDVDSCMDASPGAPGADKRAKSFCATINGLQGNPPQLWFGRICPSIIIDCATHFGGEKTSWGTEASVYVIQCAG